MTALKPDGIFLRMHSGFMRMHWLRWILFIPAGILGGVVLGLVSLVVGGATSWLLGLPFYSPGNTLLSAAVSGYVSICSAAYIAPSTSKAIPSIVMAIPLFAVNGTGIILYLTKHEWIHLAEGIVMVIGTAVSMYEHITETQQSTTKAP